MGQRVFRRSHWITQAHLIYNMENIPQNWVHWSLDKLSWVRLSFSSPFLPCCHGGEGGDGTERECIDFVVGLPLAAFQVYPDFVTLNMCTEEEEASSSSPASARAVPFMDGNPVRFLTGGV